MHLYLPRRHRRPLLFPPGLLALAGLLWLGCVALGPWQDRLKLRSVLQLTMPPIGALSPAEAKTCLFCASTLPKIIRAMGPWQKNHLTGKPENQSQERIHVTTAICAMMADSSHRGRVSISLDPTAHYKDLIFLLDLMNRENTRKYWLDIVHKPITLYALTEIRNRQDQHVYGDVILTPYTSPQIPLWTRLKDIDNWWPLFEVQPEKWQLLALPVWRWPLALLALVAGLAIWRWRP
ncbi:hypothetical protein [Hymenobacter nivis]|uniref:hypothetical protein n=1 Tax=Hymenobacter nivis TaxID=1850093 RepID=UPI0011289AF1|nr:hypothetical protein [Hymenobacter nivis]